MDLRICYIAIAIILLKIKYCKLQDGVTFPNVVRFPYGGPFMGLFLAIAIPLELPKTNVFLSYNFEANYNLPQNETTYDYPPIVSDRSLGISRKNAYDALEYKISSHGYPGRECLLRAICEAAQYSLDGNNGVLGDILHILLSFLDTKITLKQDNARIFQISGLIIIYEYKKGTVMTVAPSDIK